MPRPVGMTLEPVEHLSLTSGGMPGPESVTVKMTLSRFAWRSSRSWRPEAKTRRHWPADYTAPAPRGVRRRRSCRYGIDVDLEFDAVGCEPVLDALGGASMVLRMSIEPRLSDIAPASMSQGPGCC